MTKIHYFGTNMNSTHYKKHSVLTVECGIMVDRLIVTDKKEDVTCGNCKRLIN